MAANPTDGHSDSRGRVVSGRSISIESYDDQDAAGLEQIAESCECGREREVVEAGDRGDEIEAAGLEREGHHVAPDEAQCWTGTGGVGECVAVNIDRDDFAAPVRKLVREQATTAANIERTGTAVRNGAKNQRMVLKVMAPWVVGHRAGIYL